MTKIKTALGEREGEREGLQCPGGVKVKPWKEEGDEGMTVGRASMVVADHGTPIRVA